MQRLLSLLTLPALALALTLAGFAADDKKDVPVVPPRQGKSETIQLFNGKDLEGWEGYMDLWSVKDGAIVAKNTKPIQYSTYLLSKRKFSDFRLVLEAKLVQSEMHSGVAIWGKVFPTPPKANSKEAVSDPKAERTEYTYQGQLVMFPSGWGLYDLYRRHGAINLPADVRKLAMAAGKQHDWNHLEILAQGNRIRLVVNGKQVVDWRDPKPELIAEGPIGLQLHANSVPQEIHFKNLVLTTFPEDKLTTVK